MSNIKLIDDVDGPKQQAVSAHIKACSQCSVIGGDTCAVGKAIVAEALQELSENIEKRRKGKIGGNL